MGVSRATARVTIAMLPLAMVAVSIPTLAQIPSSPPRLQPILAGPFQLYPVAASQAEYTDNVFSAPEPEVGAVGEITSAMVYSATGGVIAELPMSRSELRIGYAARYRAYSGADVPSSLSHFFQGDGEFVFGSGFVFGFSEYFERGVLDTQELGDEVIFRGDRFSRNVAEVELGHQRGARRSLGIAAGFTTLDFDDRDTAAFFDTDEQYVRVFGEHQTGRRVWLLWDLQAADGTLIPPDPDDPDRDRDQRRAGVGAMWIPRTGSELEVRLKWTRDRFDSATPETFRGFVGSLRFSTAVPARVRLSFRADREIYPSIFGDNDHYVNSRVSVGVDSPARARLRVGARVAASWNDYPQPGLVGQTGDAVREDRNLVMRVWLGYLLRERLEWRVFAQTGSRSSVEPRLEYDARRFGVVVTLGG